MKTVPKDLPKNADTVYSNYDHVINSFVLEEIKYGLCWAQYPGRSFMAYVWFESENWYAEIWQYGVHVDTLEAETFPELKELICNKHGYE